MVWISVYIPQNHVDITIYTKVLLYYCDMVARLIANKAMVYRSLSEIYPISVSKWRFLSECMVKDASVADTEITCWGPFCLYGSTLVTTWTSYCIRYKVWDEIT